jgi:hypothetical protein
MKREHKFFERYLNNDLDRLSDFLMKKYDQIESESLRGISAMDSSDIWVESQSRSTIKWREYNVFQFYSPEIYNLYLNVRETVKEACDYYKINYNDQRFMIQGWFNINYNKKGKLDWHDHGPHGAPHFHGYYCVSAEPSSTFYKINNKKEVENINKNNRLIVSEMGHPHAMADWDWDGPRITIAYDIIPLSNLLIDDENIVEQHWFPL